MVLWARETECGWLTHSSPFPHFSKVLSTLSLSLPTLAYSSFHLQLLQHNLFHNLVLVHTEKGTDPLQADMFQLPSLRAKWSKSPQIEKNWDHAQAKCQWPGGRQPGNGNFWVCLSRSRIQHSSMSSAFFNAYFESLLKEPWDATEITMWSLMGKKKYFILSHVLPIYKLQVNHQWIIVSVKYIFILSQLNSYYEVKKQSQSQSI